MQILSYILSILGLLSLLLASVTKGERMRLILFLIFLGNVLLGTSYFVGGDGLNAALSCFLGACQTIINYTFTSRKKPIPKWLLVIYMLSFIGLNLWVEGGITLPGMLVIAASFTFIMCITQSSGIPFRLWSMANAAIYCVYDCVTTSYGALVTHVVLFLFALLGLLVVDLKLLRRKT